MQTLRAANPSTSRDQPTFVSGTGEHGSTLPMHAGFRATSWNDHFGAGGGANRSRWWPEGVGTGVLVSERGEASASLPPRRGPSQEPVVEPGLRSRHGA